MMPLQRKMGRTKGKRVKKIEVPTDTLQNLSWETRQQIYSGGGRRRRQEKGRKRHKNRGRKPGGRKLHTQQRKGAPEKRARTDRSETKMDTEAGGEANTSQSHPRHKTGHMTNIYHQRHTLDVKFSANH